MNSLPGQNWLLLRGLSRESAHWGNYLDIMQNKFPASHIHTLDLPGTGEFCRDISPATIAEITQTVRDKAIDRGYLAKPSTILALSMGGIVAWEWLHKYPNDINGAVLINTSFAYLCPFYCRLRWQNLVKFASILLQNNIDKRESAIVRLVSNNQYRRINIEAEWQRIQHLRPVEFRNTLRQIIAAARYRAAEEKPRQPVLLLNSQGDRLVAPECSVTIQKKWQIRLETHSWAGHDICVDDGVWLADQLSRWINESAAHAI